MNPQPPRPVALVTGAGAPRVGRCVAETLAARGYRLAVHAHTSLDGAEQTAAAIRAAGGEAIVAAADLRDEQQVQTMIGRITAEFGQLDAVVHCAATWPAAALEQTTAHEFEAAWRENTLATYLVCRHAGLAMAAQATGGAIVTIGDWAVIRPYTDHAAYFSSKGAITTLTRSMAVELAARNPRIRVNEIRPGPVMLPADMPQAEREATINATLLKREGSPRNVADAAIALIENDFITGASLAVDGGRSIYAPA